LISPATLPLLPLLPSLPLLAAQLPLGPWQAYCQVLERWPLLSNVALGALGAVVSDTLAQLLELRWADRQGGDSRGGGELAAGAGTGAGAVCKAGPPRPPPLPPPQQPQQQQQQQSYSAARTARLVLYSAVVGTPMAHAWFGLLDTVGCLVAWLAGLLTGCRQTTN
jgi:hypothetical protein